MFLASLPLSLINKPDRATDSKRHQSLERQAGADSKAEAKHQARLTQLEQELDKSRQEQAAKAAQLTS